MSKGDGCFYCKNSTNARPLGYSFEESLADPKDKSGWGYDCKLGIDNSELDGIPAEMGAKCPKFDPRVGFQMGGYYTHMWFEEDGDCLTWVIQGDGEFPIDENDAERKFLRFYICDFEEIEMFVKFWGDELRRRGLV